MLNKFGGGKFNWLDLARILAITCVIYGHLHPFVNESDILVRKYIYSFHMPIFFMISGFLFGEKIIDDKIKYIKVISKKLLIPYFLYNAYILFGLIFKHNSAQEVLIKLFTVNMPTNSPCWFFFAFFVIKVIADSLSYKSRIIAMLTLAITYCTSILLFGVSYDSFFCINGILCGFIFYILGQVTKVIFNYRISVKLLILLVCVLITTFAIPRLERFDMYVGNSQYPIVYIIVSVSSSLAILLLCNLIYGSLNIIKGNNFTKLSRGTMLILGTHYPIVGLLKKYFLINHHSIIDKIIICILFMFVYYFIINFTYDRFPFLYGKSNKKA